jgi:lantibiotic leader peptide-processing serine protease
MSFFVDPWLYNCTDNPFDTPQQRAEQRTIIAAMNRALEYAHAHGVTMVSSLGNENTNLDSPAIDHFSPDIKPGFEPQPPDFDPERPVDNSCVSLPTEGPHVVSVSALGPSGRKAYYSNWGLEQTDVSAPGGDRREGFGTPQFNAPGNRVLSSYPEEVAREEGSIDENGNPTTPLVIKRCAKGRCAYWEWLQGTSMASPHAAGVAALIVSAFGVRDRAHGGLTMNPNRVEAILKDTATDTPCPAQEPFHYPDPDLGPEFDALCEGTPARNGFYGDGIVNALGAVQGAAR